MIQPSLHGKSELYVSLPDNQSVLDATVKLTAQREQESLAVSLIEALASLTSACNISLARLGNELGQLSAKILASNNPQEPVGSHLTPLEAKPGLKACIDSKQPVSLESADVHKLVFPLLEQGIVAGMLCLDFAPGETPPHDTIQALTSIYNNQQSLLNHQQRDGLTGLFNRVALQNWISKTLSTPSGTDRRSRDTQPLGCFALFDIDYFKRINDSRGHLYGDQVLLTFADLMRETFRFNDLLFRYGGEEFVAILTDTSLEDALAVLERFRSTISQHKFARLNQVTVTIGATAISPHLKAETLIGRADKALYFGKEHGRNQVNAYEWLEQGQIVPALDDRPHTIKLF